MKERKQVMRKRYTSARRVKKEKNNKANEETRKGRTRRNVRTERNDAKENNNNAGEETRRGRKGKRGKKTSKEEGEMSADGEGARRQITMMQVNEGRGKWREERRGNEK